MGMVTPEGNIQKKKKVLVIEPLFRVKQLRSMRTLGKLPKVITC